MAYFSKFLRVFCFASCIHILCQFTYNDKKSKSDEWTLHVMGAASWLPCRKNTSLIVFHSAILANDTFAKYNSPLIISSASNTITKTVHTIQISSNLNLRIDASDPGSLKWSLRMFFLQGVMPHEHRTWLSILDNVLWWIEIFFCYYKNGLSSVCKC